MAELTHAQKATGSVLVVGAGIGGIQASLDLAESGFKVYVVDTLPSIGGIMARLDKTFPTNDCSMCILSPKLVECGRHRNIEVITHSEISKVEGEAGSFTVSVDQHPRYIDASKCTGCGLCAKHCPANAIDNFNKGLSERAAVYIDYPQAVPLIFAIDRGKCIGCGLCENLCLAKAVNYLDREKQRQIVVGSIILAPGAEEFNAKLKSEYGYGRFANVVTSTEFERILSASGPFRGRVQRPSDGEVPSKIAFIQCVGSRDLSCGESYCSSVCCMYATKEAVIAKEHANQVSPTIFYMDIRAYGKDFDQYVERAQDEYGVRFIRSRVASVEENSLSEDLTIRYETEDGRITNETFNLVVLSVGFQPSEKVKKLAETIGIKLDRYGYCQTDEFSPVETSRPGVFVCGVFSSPQDIPETVTQASAAATQASSLLSRERGSLVQKKEYPEETTVFGQPPRIGVFICHCGINIGGVVDVPSVAEYAKTIPNVVYAEHNLYTCSSDTQEKIKEKIKEHRLNRVIVASCTPRTHELLFQETMREAGLNRYLFEMANIRDQCSWVHMKLPKAASQKAEDLVRMAVAKARLLQPLPRVPLNITRRGLVIGGGISGMTAALAMANEGFVTYLIEKEKELGGFARNLHYTLEGNDVQSYVKSLTTKVKANKLIHVFPSADIKEISGYVGNYRTTVTDETGEDRLLEHGVVIVATGAEEYRPSEYLFGEDSRVVTQSELEKRLAAKDESGGLASDFADVVMIQCVGSRTKGRRYCSRVCCKEAVKNALKIKEINPASNVYVLYRDMRTYGFAEDQYRKAREMGVIFIRYNEDREPVVSKSEDGTGKLWVSVYEPVIREQLTLDASLVVLSVAIEPPASNRRLAQMLKVPLNEDGFFLEAHVKLRPVDCTTEGIYLCGMAHAPKSIGECTAQAYAAVSRACTILSKDMLEAEGTVAFVNKRKCTGCGSCISVCAYNAIEIDSKEKIAKVNTVLCKGCGVCSATCRSAAIDVYGFTNEELVSVVNSVLGD